jgi:hypothetical protein
VKATLPERVAPVDSSGETRGRVLVSRGLSALQLESTRARRIGTRFRIQCDDTMIVSMRRSVCVLTIAISSLYAQGTIEVNGRLALQINAILPKELIGGVDVPVQLIVGSYSSTPGTTIAVK